LARALTSPHFTLSFVSDNSNSAIAPIIWNMTGGRLVKHARYYWLLLAEGI
jgi:hypothetical protein